MKPVKITGGARIGMKNASFPFATLYADGEKLQIKVSMMGNLMFRPSDIEALEPHTIIPGIGQGIIIKHKVESYNKKIIFWTMKDPKAVIKQIEATGFFENVHTISPEVELAVQDAHLRGSGNPIKKPYLIGGIVLWNILFLLGVGGLIISEEDPYALPVGFPPLLGIQVALGLALVACILLLTSSSFRSRVLKEGRTLDDIKTVAIFMLVIISFVFFTFTMVVANIQN